MNQVVRILLLNLLTSQDQITSWEYFKPSDLLCIVKENTNKYHNMLISPSLYNKLYEQKIAEVQG